MKKVLFALVCAGIFITGMTSCSKCQLCTKEGESEVRYCKGDFNSETEYGIAIDIKEALGFNCKAFI